MRGKIFRLFWLAVLSLAIATPISAAQKVDWETLNPNLRGAASVGKTSECLECHEDYIKAFNATTHGKAYKAKFGKEPGGSCEVCHGPLGNHLAEKDESKKLSKVVSFKTLEAKDKSRICLQCHEKGMNYHWQGSPHQMAGLSCDKCHYVMVKKSSRQLFINEDSKKVCFQCHVEKRAQLQRTSHMPLREGKMTCASCHNPHGGPGPKLLKQSSVNETCYSCHQEKRGPMIFEHPPVREDCTNCHDSHGSNFESMLKMKIPFLCQTCHVAQFHPSTPYDASRLPGGSTGASDKFLGKACLNCHSKVHGSNHPSGARLTR